MSDQINISSHKGVYSVFFDTQLLNKFETFINAETHFLVDSNLARLYPTQLQEIICHKNTVLIEAKEDNKSIENIIPIFEALVANKVRRSHHLVAVGGELSKTSLVLLQAFYFVGFLGSLFQPPFSHKRIHVLDLKVQLTWDL